MAIFSDFFSISINFIKYYLHAKFQINWIIQTEITGVGQNLHPRPYQSAKGPTCLGLKALWLYRFTSFYSRNEFNFRAYQNNNGNCVDSRLVTSPHCRLATSLFPRYDKR